MYTIHIFLLISPTSDLTRYANRAYPSSFKIYANYRIIFYKTLSFWGRNYMFAFLWLFDKYISFHITLSIISPTINNVLDNLEFYDMIYTD